MAINSLLDKTPRPRSLLIQSELILDLRGVNLNANADPEDMVAVRLLVDENRIITSSHRKLFSLDEIRDNLKQGKGPTNSSHFILMLTRHIDEHITRVLARLDERIEGLEDDILLEKETELRPTLTRLRRQTIGLRRYLAPQRDALTELLQAPPSWLQPNDHKRLKEIVNKFKKHIEALDSLRDRAIVIQEDLSNRLAEQMNTRMYTLSLIATLFMPLGFLTGLLGINVGGIPGANNDYGFMIVIAMVVGVLVLQFVYLQKKKWF